MWSISVPTGHIPDADSDADTGSNTTANALGTDSAVQNTGDLADSDDGDAGDVTGINADRRPDSMRLMPL
jgi:hypothetical protein